VLGDGNNSVTGPQGSTYVKVGDGNNGITLSGYGNTVIAGNGTNAILAGDGNETVTVGGGSNAISAGGYGNVITTGNGVNSIVAGDGNATVNTNAGSDTVTLNGWNNLVIGGLGHDVIVGGAGNTYQVNGVGSTGGMDIQDFSFAKNDMLDLSQELTALGWNHSASTLGNYLQVSETGSDTIVAMNAGSGFHTVATLQGAGAASLIDLQSHNAIKLG
jgi:Ca2+-binding RTX toxin-like protein